MEGRRRRVKQAFGYKKEPGASHLDPIKSLMFLATIYKTDGLKSDEQNSFFVKAVRIEEVAFCLLYSD